MFENVDDKRMDDIRWNVDTWICHKLIYEPKGSGELKKRLVFTDFLYGIMISCIPDKDIRVFYLDRQFLFHPCYLTQDRVKITCV